MRRTEHFVARVSTATGVAATIVYLSWRALFSMSGAKWWLAGPAFFVEVVGFGGALVLAWALWPPLRRTGAVESVLKSNDGVAGVDGVVRVGSQAEHEVRATLLALRSVRHVDHLVVVDLSGRPTVASLATEFQAVYATADRDDLNGLKVLASAVRTPEFLLIDAGDIPTTDVVSRLIGEMADPHVAVVQGVGTGCCDDSPEDGPNRRHELVFERSSLNPALGTRGAAIWLGSGSLVRTAALSDLPHLDVDKLEAHWRSGLALLAKGWQVVAPATTVLAHRPLVDGAAVHADRVLRARAARRMVFGAGGALRRGRLGASQRLAVLAWSVRPLSGLRRSVFVAVLCGALIAGAAPFEASALVLGAVWLPAFCVTSLGLCLLSGWTLRPGDRVSWSLHTIGPAFTGLKAGETTSGEKRPPIVTFHQGQHGAGLIVAVIALSIVLVLRGLSERVTHTLGILPKGQLLALVVVSLWTLTMSLDLLRVLARRAQLRRRPRVASSMSATLGDRAVSVLDLTGFGAGLLGHSPMEVGQRVVLDTAIPTLSGITDVRIQCVVRNTQPTSLGEHRIGVEFVSTDDATANALAEYCDIEPIWERLGVVPGLPTIESRPRLRLPDPSDLVAGRMAVRIVSLVALVGAVASSMPSTAEASSAPIHRLSGTVVAGTEGVEDAIVVGVCSLDAGPDGAWGTADDTYGESVSAVTGADGSYELDLAGQSCWATVAPPVGYVTAQVEPGDSGEPVEVADDGELPLELASVDVSSPTSSNRTVLQREEVPVANAQSATGTGTMRIGADADVVSQLDASLDEAFASLSAAEPVAAQILPAPEPHQLAPGGVGGGTGDDRTLSIAVLVLAGVLGLSIMFGLIRPRDFAAE